jgi:hypothetical protein
MGKMKKLIIIAIIILIAVYFLYPRFQSDETRIRGMIERTAERTRRKDAFGFMQHFDKTFKDDSGLGFDEVRYIGIRVFQSYPEVGVTYTVNDLQIDDEAGTAAVSLDLSVMVVDQGETVDLIRGARKTNSFVIAVEKKQGDWVFTESRKP